ncbi:MAG: BppU family phage baseplate upper protein [Sporolactobacillus sp.]
MADFKTFSLPFDINTQSRTDSISAGVQFRSQDVGTAKLIFTIFKDGISLDLTDDTIKLNIRTADGSLFQLNGTVDDPENGVASCVLSSDVVTHYGTATAELVILYTENQSLSVSQFTFDIEQSIVDQDITPSATYYIQNLQDFMGAVNDILGPLTDNVNTQIDLINQNQVVKLPDYNADKADTAAQLATEIQNRTDADSSLTAQLADNVKKNIQNKFNLKYKNFTENVYQKMKRWVLKGDSISHGAGSLVSSENSWAGILRKFVQEELDMKNYGYVNLALPEAVQGLFDKDVIEVTPTGTWTQHNPDGSYIGGFAYESSTSGDQLSILVKKDSNLLRVFYETAADGGIVDIKINGNTELTINTSQGNASKYSVSDDIDISQYLDYFEIEIVKQDSGRTAFCGIQLLDNPPDTVFDNYSKSGLALVDTDQNTLHAELDADVVFFSLGYNDKYGRNDINGFTNKITDLISYLIQVQAFVVVIDFIWFVGQNDPFRTQLKRLADNVPGAIYIPLPDIVRFTNSTEAVSMGFLRDSAHPTPQGHQMIAEYIGKFMGLGITSKHVIERIQNDSPIISARNLVANSANVFIGNNNLNADTAVPFSFVTDMATLSNELRARTITIALAVDLDIQMQSGTVWGVDIQFIFEDGSSMWASLTNQRSLAQGYDVTTAFQSGKFKGIVNKKIYIPDKAITAISNAQLFIRNLAGESRVFMGSLMIAVGEETVGYLPAPEDIFNSSYKPMVATDAKNNSFFVDSSDNKLYFKDYSGSVHSFW